MTSPAQPSQPRSDASGSPSTATTSAADLRFRTLRPWLLESFGRPMHRVALDAGSDCPNRDGAKGRGGCFYCDVEGSGTGALREGQDLVEQLESGMLRVGRRDPDGGVIAYFQSYSNTYVSPERLDEVLECLEPYLDDGRIQCVALATRPDTLPDWALERLARLRTKARVWLELGLEAADDGVLTRINRLHTVEEFVESCARAHAHNLEVVGHAILGLPDDGREGARRSAEVLAECGVVGVKVHHLMVLKRTQFAIQHKRGELSTLDPETYVQWLGDFVERLRPEQVLHRITGDSPTEDLIAPHWGIHKNAIRQRLHNELSRRGTQQGSLLQENPETPSS